MKDTKPVTYTIDDTKGKEIQGTFYEPELQKTKQEIYRIEKVLKKRTLHVNPRALRLDPLATLTKLK